MPEMDKGRRGAVGGHRLAYQVNDVWARCRRCGLPYAAPVWGRPMLWLCLFCGWSAPQPTAWTLSDDLCVPWPRRNEPAPAFAWMRPEEGL